MFGVPQIVQISTHIRPTLGEDLGEVIATFGSVMVILLAFEISARIDPACGGSFHYESLLVYVVDIIRRSRITLARAIHR